MEDLPYKSARRETLPSRQAAGPTPGPGARDCLLARAQGDAPFMSDLPCSSPESRSRPSPRCLGVSSLSAACQASDAATRMRFGKRSRIARLTGASSQQDGSQSARERFVRTMPNGNEIDTSLPTSRDAPPLRNRNAYILAIGPTPLPVDERVQAVRRT